jgi:Kdo2-lipid IVA lauroyltransferase/acyltransferase
LPRRALGAIGQTLGVIAYRFGIRRRIVRDNLALALPEKSPAEREAIAAANYRHAGRSVLEVFAAPRLSPAQVDELLEYQGFEIFERLFAEGRGVVVASAHLGSWELLASACGRLGIPMHLVTRSLTGSANAALQRARARSGITEIPPRGALTRGAAVLKRGGVVVNLIDQNMLPKRGVFIRFFGEWACTTPAASLLGMRTGAPVIIAVAVNLPNGRTRLCIEGPFPIPSVGPIGQRVRAHTQGLAAVVERYIRAEPTQWFWLHRRWKTRPAIPPLEIPEPRPATRRNP